MGILKNRPLKFRLEKFAVWPLSAATSVVSAYICHKADSSTHVHMNKSMMRYTRLQFTCESHVNSHVKCIFRALREFTCEFEAVVKGELTCVK